MSTLKEEREAIVEEIGQLFADCFVNKARSWGEIKKDIDTALLSHEEKVMERVRKEKEDIFVEIEQFKSEVATMNYNDDFKDGIYATIEHILSMPCFESVLTPITDENV